MNNVTQIERGDCCGCSACTAVCVKEAITMSPDTQGFLYPFIDSDLCMNCGACVRACQSRKNGNGEFMRPYAAKNRDRNILAHASSGGISYALCEQMFQIGGVVYGVAYDSAHKVTYLRADKLSDCEAFFSSKYVQADPGNSMTEIARDLSEPQSRISCTQNQITLEKATLTIAEMPAISEERLDF